MFLHPTKSKPRKFYWNKSTPRSLQNKLDSLGLGMISTSNINIMEMQRERDAISLCICVYLCERDHIGR
jgi:hypothetical protein